MKKRKEKKGANNLLSSLPATFDYDKHYNTRHNYDDNNDNDCEESYPREYEHIGWSSCSCTHFTFSANSTFADS